MSDSIRIGFNLFINGIFTNVCVLKLSYSSSFKKFKDKYSTLYKPKKRGSRNSQKFFSGNLSDKNSDHIRKH